MKLKYTGLLLFLSVAIISQAQNRIITPSGKPLIIGNEGVKFTNLNSGSPTQTSNGKVLTVDANGIVFMAPDNGGAWTTSGSDVHFASGNVGIGTTTPLQRLHVNGDINVPAADGLRINNLPFLKAPGTANTVIGTNAGANIAAAGGYNLIVGSEAGFGNSGAITGSGNVLVGYRAGYNTTSGANNFYFGNQAGLTNTNGNYNLLIGSFAGQFSTASYMTAMGFEAGAYSNGPYNFYLGYQSGKASAAAPSSAQGNLFIGYRSGYVNTGAQNIFFGHSTGVNNTTGFNNIFIGSTSGANNTTGYNNILIGYGANLGGSNLKNSMAIGVNSTVDISNAIILGTTGAGQPNIGIGTTSPAARLHITAGGTTATGVRFENLPTSTGTVYPLYIDASGNIMRGANTGARKAFEEGQWTLTADNHLINNNSKGIMIGTGFSSTPEGYKLYVSDGILTEKIKVAVKSTDQWRDNVFQKDYKLKSIEEVETYISANKHLPGVPSAKEIVENGNDLHKTDAILLEKIEEMMLYIIALKKENIRLSGQNASLISLNESMHIENKQIKDKMEVDHQLLQAIIEKVEALEKK